MPVPCALSIFSAGTKASGLDTYLWGWAEECSDEVLTVQEKVGGAWTAVGEVTTAADGYFSYLVGHPQRAGLDTYRIVAGETASPEVQLERLPSLTASTAVTKPVDAVTYMWGVFQTAGRTVEVQVLAGSQWRTIGSTTAAADGYYSVPLTYGQSFVGDYRFRAVARSAYGTQVVASAALRRTARVTVSSAGSKPLMQTTYAWGRVHGQGGTPTWTEVEVQGAWARSQQVTSASDGSFTIPLTYGANVSGSYRYRIGTLTRFGTVYSSPFTLVRTTAFTSTVSNTTAADVAKTYRAGCPVGASQLSTVRMTYRDYAGATRWGEIVVRRDVAYQVRDAFGEAYNGGFRVAQMRNPNAWSGDDIAMMAANNSSAFNCRSVTGNPYRMSPHSYGRAVDVNPVQNPYLVGGKWYPSATYSTSRPRGVIGMHYSDGPFVKAMTRRGFEWFSGWDWHHFEK